MLEGYLRIGYQRIFVNHAAGFFAKYFSANFFTVLGLFFGILSPICLFYAHPFFAVGALLISGYLDTLDGTVARLRQQSTEIGAVLDIISDRLVEFGVVLGLFLVAPEARGLACILMLGSMFLCISSFLVTGIFSKKESGKSFYYSPGFMERAESFGFFIAMMLLPQYFLWLAALFIVLVLWTAVMRIYGFVVFVD